MEFTTERDFNSFVQDIQNKSSHNEFMYLSIFLVFIDLFMYY
jgi:hypothetical protein